MMLKSIQQAILILSFLNTTRDEYNYEPTSGSLVSVSPRYRHLFPLRDMRSFAHSHGTLLPIKGSICSKTSPAFLPAQIKTANNKKSCCSAFPSQSKKWCQRGAGRINGLSAPSVFSKATPLTNSSCSPLSSEVN